MKAFIKLALLGSVVVGIAYMAHLPPTPKPARYGDVARRECWQEAGRDRDSQEACVTGKLLQKWTEVQGRLR
jgi:hypothetical protein